MKQTKQTKQTKRKIRKNRKSRKNKKLSSRFLLSKKLRGGDLGNPTILTLKGTALPITTVVASASGTQPLQDYLAGQMLRGSTGYPDDD